MVDDLPHAGESHVFSAEALSEADVPILQVVAGEAAADQSEEAPRDTKADELNALEEMMRKELRKQEILGNAGL